MSNILFIVMYGIAETSLGLCGATTAIGKRDGFNECVRMLKDNLKGISEEQVHE